MIDIEIKFNPETIALIEKIPILVTYKIMDKAMPAFAKPIIARAKQIAPRSTLTGTRLKWGTNKTKHFDPVTWRRDESGDHIGYKVKKTNEGAILKVGAKSPKGNKQRFNQFKYTERRVFYWGKDMNMTYKNPYRFMQKAYDETRHEQDAAFVAVLKTELEGTKLG